MLHRTRAPHRAARYARWGFLLAVASLFSMFSVQPGTGRAATLPPGFQETVVFSGLDQPMAIRFAADGRAFVAEKAGVIKVFDGLADTTPEVFADLNANVYNFWDRGLLGLALPPNFPTDPYVYVLYTYDGLIGGPAPRWGTAGEHSDPCPSPPSPTDDGCVVSGRLSRLRADGNRMIGSEQVLIEDWCQQYPSHTIGDLAFGADGALYVSGGDGASYNWVDYGQGGGSPGSPTPKNPCGDPAGEGGALRSQDVRTPGDPVTLDGAILRIDPATGQALPNNPLANNPDPNARRIIAHGLRNPFRFTTRPGTNELWVGDVGWYDWEEINRIPNPADSMVENFGWPCYEGSARQWGYGGTNLAICETMYAQGNANTRPFFAYDHKDDVVANDGCAPGSSSLSGLAFAGSGAYPAAYDGALLFADYSRNCIWAMLQGANNQPDPGTIRPLVSDAAGPVNLERGPNGDVFYVAVHDGTIRRIRYVGDTTPTTCAVGEYTAEYYNNVTLSGTPALTQCEPSVNHTWGANSPASGIAPDQFSARWTSQQQFAAGSYTFTARADDGIRVFVDGVQIIDAWRDQEATTFTATHTLTAGEHEVKVEYYDKSWDATAQLRWETAQTPPPNTPPTAAITAPAAGTTWKVGDVMNFAGAATDAEDGPLPPSALRWEVVLQHCPSNCHAHVVQQFVGVASGQFTAPDHEYPSHLELRLTATDAKGLSDTKSIRLDPRTVVLTFDTSVSGLQLTVDGSTSPTSFTRTVIVGSKHSLSAPASQTLGDKTYTFAAWTDRATAHTRDITAPATATTYTAQYQAWIKHYIPLTTTSRAPDQ